MSSDEAFDEILTPEEAESLELQKAVCEADLERIAQHLRRGTTPYPFVLEALADMLQPPSPLPPHQIWRLELKRLRRGRPSGIANTKRTRMIALDYQKEKRKHLARYKSERGLEKRVIYIVAKRHNVDEKTVRNSLLRLKFRDAR